MSGPPVGPGSGSPIFLNVYSTVTHLLPFRFKDIYGKGILWIHGDKDLIEQSHKVWRHDPENARTHSTFGMRFWTDYVGGVVHSALLAERAYVGFTKMLFGDWLPIDLPGERLHAPPTVVRNNGQTIEFEQRIRAAFGGGKLGAFIGGLWGPATPIAWLLLKTISTMREISPQVRSTVDSLMPSIANMARRNRYVAGVEVVKQMLLRTVAGGAIGAGTGTLLVAPPSATLRYDVTFPKNVNEPAKIRLLSLRGTGWPLTRVQIVVETPAGIQVLILEAEPEVLPKDYHKPHKWDLKLHEGEKDLLVRVKLAAFIPRNGNAPMSTSDSLESLALDQGVHEAMESDLSLVRVRRD
jgi:hypothetical protein